MEVVVDVPAPAILRAALSLRDSPPRWTLAVRYGRLSRY
jgi:hypothetical protein